MKLEFWFEFGSTYSYPTAMRIERVVKDKGIELTWCPFLLGPIFNAQGWSDSPFKLYPAKGVYMWKDLERICQAQGIPLKKSSIFPQNGLLAARVATSSVQEPWLPEFVRAVYQSSFEKDLDISKPEVVAQCLPLPAAEAAVILEEAQSQRIKDRLRANTDKAQQLGIFGAPSFIVENELYWGNDRLVSAVEAAIR